MRKWLLLAGLLPVLSAQAELPLKLLQVPGGHEITLAAEVAGARQLALGEGGTLFVGNREDDSITALRDTDGDGRYDQRFAIGAGLSIPNGVAVHQGDLYVAEVNRIWRYPAIEQRLPDIPARQLITDQLPRNRHHGAKYLAAGPDGWLYFNVGAPCNVCLPDNPLFATISRINPRSGRIEIVAQGVRNSVGMDWHPVSGQLWFTDNGRDLLGDDLPDDELNRLTEPGQHFGFPFFHSDHKGRPVPDPVYAATAETNDFVAPVLGLGAHVAALGMTFYQGDQLPKTSVNTLFVAQHGSWNRSQKSGYRVMKLQTENGRVTSYKPFVTGFLQGQNAWGRPVDVLVDRDGSLLISDDQAGAIYRVSARR
ncbi:PQQ-dependent sugar dehydrogenase [Marinobacterium rhizophilum]|uniref:PQQ-dependent sugar dehydrogenase n=1 Tax=Marinobacterium rhizophilum TaxID=420402 RepID=A0ABY5HEN8_9GAMM|nr:PQQ-dependent sugar dehydrogenase [Marinobacterium rhizophilum]UTW10750.1 PQQ-dependent sugar dehydrogenase [Marinobacterium rhizophilum]